MWGGSDTVNSDLLEVHSGCGQRVDREREKECSGRLKWKIPAMIPNIEEWGPGLKAKGSVVRLFRRWGSMGLVECRLWEVGRWQETLGFPTHIPLDTCLYTRWHDRPGPCLLKVFLWLPRLLSPNMDLEQFSSSHQLCGLGQMAQPLNLNSLIYNDYLCSLGLSKITVRTM